MGALALRQLDQMLELRAMAHAGAHRRRVPSGTVSSLHAAILGLQRSAGNQAVASLLAVQRCGGMPCDCDHDERHATRLQRDDSDAGGDAPVRLGTTCRVFTSFADDFLGTAPHSPFAAQTAFDFSIRDGRIAADADKAGSWVTGGRSPSTAAPPRPAARSETVKGR